MSPKYAADQPKGFVNQVKNVAIVGGSGQVGTHIITELLKTGQHTVTAITREESKSTFLDGVKVTKVNYDEPSSLVNALRGQDVLIITMNVMAPADSSARLVEAAIKAGVPWILPNEYGSDYTNADINRDTGIGEAQLTIRRLIESKGTNSAWIAVACGFWYDYSLPGGMVTFGFDFDKKEVTFYDDGKFKMYYSTLPYTGQGVAKLLNLPILPKDASDKNPCLEDYRNNICRIHAFHLDQQDMLASVLRVTGDKESEWTIKYKSSEDVYNGGKQAYEGGDFRGWRLMLYSRMFYPSHQVKKLEDYSDERLGLKQPDLDEATKWGLDQLQKGGA